MPRVRRCREAGCHEVVTLDHYYCSKHRDHEAAYLAQLQKWARSRETGYRLRYDKQTRNRNEQKSEQYRFYNSKAWKNLRPQILMRDEYLDQYLKILEIYEPADTVDHVVPIEFNPDLKSAPENLISCSRTTHLIKTAWEKDYYFEGGVKKKNVKEIKTIGEIVGFLAPLGLGKEKAHK